MKAYNGHHDLLFKVPREYSVRSVSTDLVVKVNGVDVLVEYPEDDINFDFYEKDLQLIQEIQSSLETPKMITEQSTFFHHISSSRASNRCGSVQGVTFLDKEYIIGLDDEDCLSDLDLEETGLEDNDLFVGEESLKKSSLSNGSDYFSTSNNSNYFSKHALKLVSSLKPHENKQNPKQRSTAAAESSDITNPSLAASLGHLRDLNSLTVSTESVKLSEDVKEETSGQTGKKNTRRRRKKGNASKGEAKEGQETEETKLNQAPSVQLNVQDSVSGEDNDQDSNNVVRGDGSQLLAMIWPQCLDFSELDAKVMPEVHTKWRRFVEIKDSMRKERYLEYLKQKGTDTAVDIVDSSQQPSKQL